MDAGSDIPARARRCRRIPACAMSAPSSRLRRAIAFAAGRRSAPDKSELGPARRKAIDLGTPSFRRVGVVAPRSVFRAFGGAIKARLDWADIVPRWPARPPGPRARPARACRLPTALPNPCYAPLDAPYHPPQPRPARRRALRAARRDVSGRRGHPLSRTGAARSRGGMAAACHPRRSLGAARLRHFCLHREDLRYVRGQMRSLVPRGLAGAGDRLLVPPRVLGTRIRDGSRERVSAVRVRSVAGAHSDQFGASGQPPLAACGRTGRREGRAGNGFARASGASFSVAAPLTFPVVAPEEFG